MKLLIRTSSGPYGAALFEGDRCIAQRETALDALRSRNIGELVAQLLAETGTDLRDINEIGVDLGPGGLSSARSGVSYANALAFGSGAALWGVSALDLQRACAGPGRVLSMRPAAGRKCLWALYHDDRFITAGCDDPTTAVDKGAARGASRAIGPMQRFALPDSPIELVDLDPPSFDAFARVPHRVPIGAPPILTPITSAEALRPPVTPTQAADVLRGGGVVLLPTETVYGLAAMPTHPGAVERIFALKARPAQKALPIMVADLDQARDIGAQITPLVTRLNAQFCPGPLSLVVGIEPARAPWLHERDELAFRIPDDAFLQALLRETGPLFVTSANRSGADPAPDIEAALAQLNGAPDLAVPGPQRGTQPSTLINCRLSPPVIERAGMIPPDQLAEFL